jgi:hypothetical protein
MPDSAPMIAPKQPVQGDEQGGDDGVEPVHKAEQPADQDTGERTARRSVKRGPAVVHPADHLLDQAQALADDRRPLHGKPVVREVVNGACGFPVRLVRGNRPAMLLGHRPALPAGAHGRFRTLPRVASRVAPRLRLASQKCTGPVAPRVREESEHFG